MALSAGTVTVNAAGTASGSGASLRLYNKRVSAAAAAYPGGMLPPGLPGVKLKQSIALFAQADAEWMVEEIVGFATAKIPASAAGDGLQRQTDPVADTSRPTVDKFLVIV